MDGPAAAALPVLVKAAEGRLPGRSKQFRTAAVDALGKAGAAASAALPALKRALEEESQSRNGFADFEEWQREAAWRSHLESAIRKIEGKVPPAGR